jgi:glycosyltransferase involved in cell wall biosynthesis
MPRFTILMPTHNRADVIGFAIRSVLMQSEEDFELLVVGDGCTDDTANVVQSFADQRIRWFDLPKAPYFGYANRNIALRDARGEVIAFVAHDDLVFPDHLALLGRAIEEGADWAYSRPIFVSSDGVVLPFCTNLTIDGERAFFLEQANTIPASCVMHRRDCLDRFGYWPEDLRKGGDWALWKKIIGGGARVAYVAVPTTLHFRAGWRKGRVPGARFAHTVLAIADAAEWWPPSLKQDIPEGVTEQAVFFDRMAQGGAAWCASFRADVTRAIDRIAWDNVRNASL